MIKYDPTLFQDIDIFILLSSWSKLVKLDILQRLLYHMCISLHCLININFLVLPDFVSHFLIFWISILQSCVWKLSWPDQKVWSDVLQTVLSQQCQGNWLYQGNCCRSQYKFTNSYSHAQVLSYIQVLIEETNVFTVFHCSIAEAFAVTSTTCCQAVTSQYLLLKGLSRWWRVFRSFLLFMYPDIISYYFSRIQ